MHPRYKENIGRYIKVVRNLTIDESPSELQERLVKLRTQLLDPLTTARAALRLEAIGSDQAAKILEEGIESEDTEVRFYSAEALAYLDKTSAVEPLAQAALNEPAFRVNSLAALSAMEDIVAYDALRSMLDRKSAETRYGAFRALWSMNSSDPLVRGEQLGDKFSYHILDVGGPPMVHLTRSHRPELVLFGVDQPLTTPLVLDAGKNILVNGMQGDQIIVSRFSSGEPVQKRVISPTVDELVRAIVELGGGYPDVVQALRQAKKDGALTSRLAVDALPQTGREFRRGDEDLPPEEAGAAPYKVATPLPDLFSSKKQ
jgi:DNA-directed RNA polymerase subunit F